jgi:hypothetical protein
MYERNFDTSNPEILSALENEYGALLDLLGEFRKDQQTSAEDKLQLLESTLQMARTIFQIALMVREG